MTVRSLRLSGPAGRACPTGRGVVEDTVSVPRGLFGILTTKRTRLWPRTSDAIFLNVANQHMSVRIALVEWSRQWAMAVSARSVGSEWPGDSPDRQAEGAVAVLQAGAFDDVVDAVGWVSPDNPSNVILVACARVLPGARERTGDPARGVWPSTL